VTSKKPLRVIVVDDENLVRAALVKMVNSQADMMVVAEAADGPRPVFCLRTPIRNGSFTRSGR